MARRGRRPKTSEDRLRDALKRDQPAEHILKRREMFSFVKPQKGGEVDSEVSDAIGQLHALGYFDGHGHDPIAMRDQGRFWGYRYAMLMKLVGAKTGSFEQRSKSTGAAARVGRADLLFDRMDESLPAYERKVLMSLIVDPIIGTHPLGEFALWAQALIDDGLAQRGKFVRERLYPTANDYWLLHAAIRGLAILVDGSLPARWAA